MQKSTESLKLEKMLGIRDISSMKQEDMKNKQVVWIHPDFDWTLVPELADPNNFSLVKEIDKLSKSLLDYSTRLPKEFFDKSLSDKRLSLSKLEGEEYFRVKDETDILSRNGNSRLRDHIVISSSGLYDLARRINYYEVLSSREDVTLSLGIAESKTNPFLKDLVKKRKKNTFFFLTKTPGHGFLKEEYKEVFKNIAGKNPKCYLFGAYYGECVDMALSDLYPIFNEVLLLKDASIVRQTAGDIRGYHISFELLDMLRNVVREKSKRGKIELLLREGEKIFQRDNSYHARTERLARQTYHQSQLREHIHKIKVISAQESFPIIGI